MTKEQALNYLKSSGFSDDQVDTIVKAFEPTTKNDLAVDKAKKDAELIARGDVINMIKELPSVTPIRPKGHWIESDYGNMITQHRWYCSECGGIHNDPESGEWREVFDFKYDYCPLCGADMREVEE